MPKTGRHRTERERAAIHFLSNVSFDSTTTEKCYQAPPDSECECDKCKNSFIKNAKFIPPLISTFDEGESLLSPLTKEVEAEDELMDLWSLNSATINSKNSPLPLGDDPAPISTWNEG